MNKVKIPSLQNPEYLDPSFIDILNEIKKQENKIRYIRGQITKNKHILKEVYNLDYDKFKCKLNDNQKGSYG